MESQGAATTATYTYGNALVRKDGETPLFDGLGSERTVTNTVGAVQGTLTMTAFGQAVSSSESSTDPYGFAATSGYRSDGDAGLMLVGARYYDAQVGAFISRDTYLDQLPYTYCDGDPVNATDPDGHAAKKKKAVPIDGPPADWPDNIGIDIGPIHLEWTGPHAWKMLSPAKRQEILDDIHAAEKVQAGKGLKGVLLGVPK